MTAWMEERMKERLGKLLKELSLLDGLPRHEQPGVAKVLPECVDRTQ